MASKNKTGLTLNPLKNFSSYFEIDTKEMDRYGIFDQIIGYDSPLFFNIFLILNSKEKIYQPFIKEFNDFFDTIAGFLMSAKATDKSDINWEAAIEYFKGSEISGTGIGYSDTCESGRGAGIQNINQILYRMKNIISAGYANPKIFLTLQILQQGIGRDRISDITLNILKTQLYEYTENSLNKLKVAQDKRQIFQIKGRKYSLVANPANQKHPIILLPKDVLSSLGNKDDDLHTIYAENIQFRKLVHEYLGEKLYKTVGKRKKEISKKERTKLILDELKANDELLIKFIEMLQDTPFGKKYDESQPVYKRAEIYNEIQKQSSFSYNEQESLHANIRNIIGDFKNIIETKGMWKLMWHKDKCLPEKYFQQLLLLHKYDDLRCYAIDSYIEPDIGNGRPDCIFAKDGKEIIMELKLSTNNKVTSGYETQYQLYKNTINANGFYVIGQNDDKKDKDIATLKKQKDDVIVIDIQQQTSPSHR